MIGCFCCVGYHLKGQKPGENAGDFGGEFLLRRMPLKGKMTGFVWGEQMGRKVAKIEFFKVENRVKNGHLSADKWTKCSDKVFVLKKTFTRSDNV